MDVSDVGAALAYAAFYLIVLTLAVTWIVQLLLRPQTRMEWAEFGKISAFLAIVVRTAWTLKTGQVLPPEVAVVFWVVCSMLVLNYLVAMLDDWGPPLVRAASGVSMGRWQWLIAALVLLLVAAVAYASFFS